ncbi:nitric oxide synthase-interacting protein homolog [Aethina tumida]|uniref:nitric oxide synthase-interacting protein homolog n=1 Tax=Aethina tumida TaxID=116153 RepID=UPI00096B6862|nr:nitric oxide synthase-interacting protein homolog [Aethina tumida]
MTRHARNCTAGAFYTYHEKKKDTQNSGYGTQHRRLEKYSIKDFDCCSLTLQPCKNPVITKDGYLFDKEAILEYIVFKKNEYYKKLKEYERQKNKNKEQNILEEAKAFQNKMNSFLIFEKSIVSRSTNVIKESDALTPSISNMLNGNEMELPSFWVPTKTPSINKPEIEKPDKTIYCPISKKPLKAKDLIDVKFTPIKDPNVKKPMVVKEDRYKCAVTHDVLTNAVPCAVLKPTGDVVTLECVERIIKKDWIHPLTGMKLKEKDIIIMQRGGTGYAQTNENLQARESRPVLQV